jgi:hypothetical protein
MLRDVLSDSVQKGQQVMTHAIIRGKNGRRHEVDFSDPPLRVEVYASEETVEIFVEADFETHAEERRRFAILNVPRHLFSEATGQAARRAARKKHADPEVS